MRFFYQYLVQLPIYKIDNSDRLNNENEHKIVQLVNQILLLNEKLEETTVPQEKVKINNYIDSIDKAIDKVIFELYGLSGKEITIVEESTSKRSDGA